MSKGIAHPSQMGEMRVVKVPHWARAREYTDEILRFWAGRMRDAEEAGPVRMRASENLMDRAWGKAPVIVSGDGEAPIRIDVRAFDASAIAGLESALMSALGEGLSAALGESRSQTGAIIEGDLVPADAHIAASEPDIT